MTADVIQQVVLVTGRVLHGGTGKPVDGLVKITVDCGPVTIRSLDDGNFAVAGVPELVFPKLATTPATIVVTINAKSAQWLTGEASVVLPPIPVPVGHDFFADGGTLEASPSVILLPANTADVRGRVMRAGSPVMGASVAILPSSGVAPPVQVTDAEGRYAFAAVDVPPGSSIRCTAGGAVVDRALQIDFFSGVTFEHFRLPAL